MSGNADGGFVSRQLIDEIDQALEFSIKVEGRLALDEITNYEEVYLGLSALNFGNISDRPLGTKRNCSGARRTS